ncbi:MAG: hypothetical protein ACYTFD_19775 [Planctomycetota bacterium]
MEGRAIRIAVVMLAFWPGLAAAGGKKAENLVANGGFEQTLKGWTINARTGQATFELDTRTKKKGKRSLRVSKTGAFSHGDGCFHDFELPPRARSGRIQVRVQVKARKLRNAWFRFQLLDPTGRYLLEEPDLHHPALNGTFAWKRLAKTYEIPPGAVRGRLILDIYFGETIWLDQIEVTHLPAKKGKRQKTPPLALANGGFDGTARGWAKLRSPAEALAFHADSRVKAAGKGSLRLERDFPRLLPQEGVYADVSELGRKKRVTLALQARVTDGARAVAALLAFNEYDAFLAVARTELREAKEGFTPLRVELTLPRGTTRLRVALALEGSGKVWFDAVALEGK